MCTVFMLFSFFEKFSDIAIKTDGFSSKINENVVFESMIEIASMLPFT